MTHLYLVWERHSELLRCRPAGVKEVAVFWGLALVDVERCWRGAPLGGRYLLALVEIVAELRRACPLAPSATTWTNAGAEVS
jgi:hypothetical protein